MCPGGWWICRPRSPIAVSTPDFPLPPTAEHPWAAHIDERLRAHGVHPFPVPRAILSKRRGERNVCEYAGYCASYGCTSGAKGSSLEAFLGRALATGRTRIRPRTIATRLESDESGRVVRAHCMHADGTPGTVEAQVFVVACQAIESARLLMKSPGRRHPKGLANGSGQVGRNLLFSTFSGGLGDFANDAFPQFVSKQPFVNRAVQDWYAVQDDTVYKGGTVSFLPAHPNPIFAAESEASWWDVAPGEIVIGPALKARLEDYFQHHQHLKFEVFGEWLPHDACWVKLDRHTKDRFGQPVARIQAQTHERSMATARFLAERGTELMHALGATTVRAPKRVGGPSKNLVGGTCRFGTDPATSVLDPDCRAHECENLFVTDGSFMPSGGSATFTFTIYANALRVADKIVTQLGGKR